VKALCTDEPISSLSDHTMRLVARGGRKSGNAVDGMQRASGSSPSAIGDGSWPRPVGLV
jgi:hypothetical protein